MVLVLSVSTMYGCLFSGTNSEDFADANEDFVDASDSGSNCSGSLCSAIEVVSLGLPQPSRLAADNSALYWSNKGVEDVLGNLGVPSIMASSLDGSEIHKLSDTGSEPVDLAAANGYVYWRQESDLWRVSVTGESPKEIVFSATGTFKYQLVPVGVVVAVPTDQGIVVSQMDFDGASSSEFTVPGHEGVDGAVVVGDSLVVITGMYRGKVLVIPLDGISPTRLLFNDSNWEPFDEIYDSIRTDGTSLFLVSGHPNGVIYSVNFLDSQSLIVFRPTNQESVSEVEVANNSIVAGYFGTSAFHIAKANKIPAEREDLVSMDTERSFGDIVVSGEYLYWSVPGSRTEATGSISRIAIQ